jgi:hypothetical protein
MLQLSWNLILKRFSLWEAFFLAHSKSLPKVSVKKSSAFIKALLGVKVFN